MRNRYHILCLVCLAIALLMKSNTTLAATQKGPLEKETIIVGGDYDYKPYTYLDNNGEARGLDVEIIKQIAKAYGFKVEFRFTEWEEALNNLKTGKVDLLLATLYTDVRDSIFDFTIPYNEDHYDIIVRKNSPIEEIGDLANKQIISLKGDASISRFIEPMALYKNTTEVGSLPKAIRLLSEGNGDAVLAPYSIAMQTIDDANIKNLKPIGYSIMPILYRFAVKNGDTELLSVLNDGIDELKATGIKEKLQNDWKIYQRKQISVIRVLRYIGIGLIPIIILIIILVIWTRMLRKRVAEKTKSLQEKTDSLEAMVKTKDKLFSIIAHDLKAPFNSILGLSDLLQEDDDSNDIEHSKYLAKHIHTSAKNTLNLLENLLSWAKMQTGQMNFNPETLLLQDITNNVADILSASAKIKNISIEQNINNDIQIFADKNMLKSILYNLVSNAIKFTPQNGTVNINAEQTNTSTQIKITDNGVGISPKNQQNLFSLSSGTTSRGTEKEKGSGLGLILCKEFIDQHKGQIHVESEENIGTTFTIVLPFPKS